MPKLTKADIQKRLVAAGHADLAKAFEAVDGPEMTPPDPDNRDPEYVYMGKRRYKIDILPDTESKGDLKKVGGNPTIIIHDITTKKPVMKCTWDEGRLFMKKLKAVIDLAEHG